MKTVLLVMLATAGAMCADFSSMVTARMGEDRTGCVAIRPSTQEVLVNQYLFRFDGTYNRVLSFKYGGLTCFDKNGSAWVVSGDSGVICIAAKDTVVYNQWDGLSSMNGRCVAYDSVNNTIYVGTVKGLSFSKLDANSHPIKWTNLLDVPLEEIIVGRNGTIMALYSTCIYLINGTSVTPYTELYSTKHGTIDTAGNFWVVFARPVSSDLLGAYNHGVAMFDGTKWVETIIGTTAPLASLDTVKVAIGNIKIDCHNTLWFSNCAGYVGSMNLETKEINFTAPGQYTWNPRKQEVAMTINPINGEIFYSGHLYFVYPQTTNAVRPKAGTFKIAPKNIEDFSVYNVLGRKIGRVNCFSSNSAHSTGAYFLYQSGQRTVAKAQLLVK